MVREENTRRSSRLREFVIPRKRERDFKNLKKKELREFEGGIGKLDPNSGGKR